MANLKSRLPIMEESTSREKVLKKVRNSLIYKTDNPFSNVDLDSPIYKEIKESADVNFAIEFTKTGGKFIYCEDQKELVDSLKAVYRDHVWTEIVCLDAELQYYLNLAEIPFMTDSDSFHEMKIGITGCEYLISRLGSVMVSSKSGSGRRMNIYPETHIIVAYTWQLVEDLKQALLKIQKRYGSKLPSLISVITGPSRSADIEKTLVMGAHGPRELYVFLVEAEKPGAENV
jgi:L-lactate dehydrogenase complex protein LldG